MYQDNDLISQCADKLAVRNYIENLNPIMKKYLIELIGIYSKAEDINWNVLPNKFVIKCNHGCGYNIIVKDKTEEDKKAICRQLNYWLEENYGIISSELHYKKIVPQIIIEKFIEGKDGSLPIDYKFFVSRGKAICCLLIVGRDTVKQRIFVDEKFDDLKLVNEYSGDDYHTLKPQSYDEMISVAKILGENFPFVRVDLYDTDGRVYFGELTFTPHGCNHDYLSYEAQKWIGDQIKM